jgi:hypothetical protein
VTQNLTNMTDKTFKSTCTQIPLKVGCLFYDAFSVTRLYSIDDRMIGE